MAMVRTVTHSTPISEINSLLEEDGCVVITGLLDKTATKKLKEDIDAGFSKIPLCQGNFFGFATKRMSGIFGKSDVPKGMAIHPAVLEVMDNFLLKNCREYQLNLTQAIQIFPGEPAQITHSDDLMFPFELAALGDQKMINCMWAVDDFTVENGATHLVPGSHKWSRERQPVPDEITYGEMPAGSVLIYFGSLLHGGGANKTQAPRTGLVISYCLGWLRQAENQYLATPLELAKTLPNRLQRLLGYFVHEPNLGCVEGRNPIELLTEEADFNSRFEEFIPQEVQEVLAEHRQKMVA